jgi:hypothetical protein
MVRREANERAGWDAFHRVPLLLRESALRAGSPNSFNPRTAKATASKAKLSAQSNDSGNAGGRTERLHHPPNGGAPGCSMCCGLGCCFSHEALKDAVEAEQWGRKAAEQGDAAGQYNLGLYYLDAVGVARDTAEAAKWFRKAAEQGNPYAQINLGVCLFMGEGVAKDYVEGHKWLNLASARGGENAKRAKPSAAQQMTPKQIAGASRSECRAGESGSNSRHGVRHSPVTFQEILCI